MKKKMKKLLCLALTLILSVGLLAGCSSSDDSEDTYEEFTLAGTSWDCDEEEASLVFYDETTGAQSGYYYTTEFTYSFDGETVYFETDYVSIEGTYEDGCLILDDLIFYQVDSAYYVQGAASGGAEEELNGSFCDIYTGYTLTFDGIENVQYDTDDRAGTGTYSYDGDTLTVSVIGDSGSVEDFYGYVDEYGSIVITVFGDDGYYEYGYTDSSSDDTSSSSYQLNATYYNEDAGITIYTSIEYLCWILDDDGGYYTGTYSIAADGEMVIEGDDGQFTLYGFYSYDDNCFELYDYDGIFYKR